MGDAMTSVRGPAASPFEALLYIDQAVLDAMPSGVYICAADGTIARFNRAAAQLWGRTPQVDDTDERFCGAFRLYRLDGEPLPHDETPMAEALRTGLPQHNHEVTIERPDGSRVVAKVDVEPLLGPHGDVQGAINCFSNITERKLAEAFLAERMSEQAVLYEFVDRLCRAGTRSDLYDATLDAVTSTLECRRASILLFDAGGVMRFVAWRGLSHDYRTAVEGHTPWQHGEAGAQPILIDDFEATDEPEALKATIRAEGIRGLGFIPLIVDGGVIGKFMTYYDAPHTFDRHEVDLALTIARQLGVSLERLQAEEERLAAVEALSRNEGRLRLAAQAGKVGLWDCDLVADRVTWTDAMYAMHGLTAETFEGTMNAFAAVVHPDERERVHGTISRVLDSGTDTAFELEFRARRGDDGRTVWLHSNAQILREDGKPVRMTGATVDITDRKEAEERLREKSAQLETVMETVPAAIWIAHDPDARQITGSRHAAEMLRVPREANQSLTAPDDERPQNFRLLKDGVALSPADLPVQRAARGEEIRGEELEIAFADGSAVWEMVNATPIRNAQNAVIGSVGVALDITDRKQAEQHRQLLIDELNHRVKNTLAIVQAVAQLTFNGDRPAEEMREAFLGRIGALAASHNLLTVGNWESAWLHELAAEVLGGCGPPQDRVSRDGPPVLLQPKQAGTMAMALHELCTNAMKHGALSGEAGAIDLSWAIVFPKGGVGAARLRLKWCERDGPPVVPPRRRGFGSRMIEQALAQDLNGTVTMDFRPDGLVCSIDAPLPDVAGHA